MLYHVSRLLWALLSLKSTAFLLQLRSTTLQRPRSCIYGSAVQIGIEAHCQISADRKAFCNCRRATSTSSAPNRHICPICTGEPGSLPLPNIGAIGAGARVASVLCCQVADTLLFDRKNYFYPDMPKSYQITQHRHPIGHNGYMMLSTGLLLVYLNFTVV